jgi:uncharacterized C2H2 Zn-finger protein
VTEIKGDGFYIFECPNCGGVVQVQKNETRCCIFRHAVYKNTFQQIGPHTPKVECDRLINQGLVEGCAKPFRFIFSGDGNWVEECDYI